MDVVTFGVVVPASSIRRRHCQGHLALKPPKPSPMTFSATAPLRRHLLLVLAVACCVVSVCVAHGDHSPPCPFSSAPAVVAGSEQHHGHGHEHHHGCDHHHHDDHHHHHNEHHGHRDIRRAKLPEELEEERDLMLDDLDHHHHHHHHHNHHDHHSHGYNEVEQPTIGVWEKAMGCSLLVSIASLICLILLPVIFLQGKPSKAVVDFLALFGAGAMLGDAFLHQLPHAFGGGHSHEHHDHDLEHGHAHSLQDLSIVLSVLFGIVLFLLVEKIVRYVEDHSGKVLGHGHHHHKHNNKVKEENEIHQESDSKVNNQDTTDTSNAAKEKDLLDGELVSRQSDGARHDTVLRKRVNSSSATDDGKEDSNVGNSSRPSTSCKASSAPQSSLVFGYLNLFSDGVVGDFGILVRSGFSVPKALFFNFLSALVALAGTALALILGKDPGQSSLIEGFTAGGFIYIAVAGVIPEMNDGKTTFKGTILQLTALVLGISVAMFISLVE